MNFYEVFLGLDHHGRKIGGTCIQLPAESPFMAAVRAENVINDRYGADVISHCLRVSPITEDEFIYCRAA